MGAQITFGTYSFDATGTPRFGMNTTFEGAENGVSRARQTVYSIKQEFFESGFAENQARIAALRDALAAGEGVLQILDEHGGEIVNGRVRVRSHDLPQQWGEYVGEVNIVLEGTIPVALDYAQASFTPLGDLPVALPSVLSWRESFRTDRYDIQSADRKETIQTITASGEYLPDPSLSPSDRQAALIAKRQQIEKLKAKDGKLLFAGEERTVRVETAECNLGSTTEKLEWTISAFYRAFPDGDFAQAEFSVTLRDDAQNGKLLTNVKGKVRASTEAAATSKISTIQARYTSSGRLLVSKETNSNYIEGPDGSDWIESAFDFQFEESMASLYYELRVRTREDVKSADTIVTYEGVARGKTSTEALQKARSLGSGKGNFLLTSDEQVASKGRDSTSEFVEVTFSYEYLNKSATWAYAEVRSEVVSDAFSESRKIISGFACASDETTARELGRSFKDAGSILRESRESTASKTAVQSGSRRQLLDRFEFSYTFYASPASVSLSYTQRETKNYESGEYLVQVSGISYGNSESACRSAVLTLRNQLSGTGNLVLDEVAPSYEVVNGAQQFISLAFTFNFKSVISSGSSLLESEVTVMTQASISKTVVTFIPFGQPFIQTDAGTTPGRRVVSGYAVARSAGAAKGFASSQKSKLGGGYLDDQQISETERSTASGSQDIKEYRCSFSYTAIFQNLS